MKAKRKPATKAKRRPSTKGAIARQHAVHDKLSRAYMDQEDPICDLLTMAEIAYHLNEKGQMIFAISHLRDMIDDFRQNWYNQHKASGAGCDEGAVS
jgi:hypothetical protein